MSGPTTTPSILDAERTALLARTIARDLTRDELEVFVATANRLGLDPFARQIYGFRRGGKLSVQVSIDGFRAVAARTGEFQGQVGPQWCGPDGQWRDVWLEKSPPAAARVGVWRRGFREPLTAVALWSEYGSGAGMWSKMGALMLAKCAEALALRRAFPEQLGGVYSTDEMRQAEPGAEPSEAVDGEKVRNAWATGAPKRAPKAPPPHGIEPGAFIEALGATKEDVAIQGLEADPVAGAVRGLVTELVATGAMEWRGEPAQLLEVLGGRAGDEARRGKRWPKNPGALGNALKRLAPSLLEVGVEVLTGIKVGKGRRLVALRGVAGGDRSALPAGSPPARGSGQA